MNLEQLTREVNDLRKRQEQTDRLVRTSWVGKSDLVAALNEISALKNRIVTMERMSGIGRDEVCACEGGMSVCEQSNCPLLPGVSCAAYHVSGERDFR